MRIVKTDSTEYQAETLAYSTFQFVMLAARHSQLTGAILAYPKGGRGLVEVKLQDIDLGRTARAYQEGRK